MLEHLYIQNFILIDQLELDFPVGFSAITGETGAGKSIFLDALSLLQGQKASSSMVSKDKAIIEGSFSLEGNSPVSSFLKENGFDVEDFFTVTREILSSGKSTARVNRRIVPLSFLHTLLENQLDIHGQKDSAYLLQKMNHIYLLDKYGHFYHQKEEIKEAYENYKKVLEEKENFLNTQLKEEELDFYQFQLHELEEAHLKKGEEEELKDLEKQAKEAKKSAQDYLSLFAYYDTEVSDSLYQTIKMTDRLKGVEENLTKIHEAYENLVDGLESIRDQLNPDFLNEDEINQVDWNRVAEHQDTVDYVRGLIKLRKSSPLFRQNSYDEILNSLAVYQLHDGVIAYQLEDENSAYFVMINANDWRMPITYLPHGLYRKVIVDYTAPLEEGQVFDLNGHYEMPGLSVTVLERVEKAE